MTPFLANSTAMKLSERPVSWKKYVNWRRTWAVCRRVNRTIRILGVSQFWTTISLWRWTLKAWHRWTFYLSDCKVKWMKWYDTILGHWNRTFRSRARPTGLSNKLSQNPSLRAESAFYQTKLKRFWLKSKVRVKRRLFIRRLWECWGRGVMITCPQATQTYSSPHSKICQKTHLPKKSTEAWCQETPTQRQSLSLCKSYRKFFKERKS